MEQGFSGSQVKAAVKHVPHRAPAHGTDIARSASGAAGAQTRAHVKPTATDHVIGTAQSVQGWAYSLFNVELIGGLGLGAASWLSKKAKLESATGVIDKAKDGIAAIRGTTFAEAGEKLVAKGGLLSQVGKVLGKGRNVSIFTGVIGVGAVAGSVATWLNGFKMSAEGRKVLGELEADLGTKNHPLYAAFSKVQGRRSGMQHVASGLLTAGEGLMVATTHGLGANAKGLGMGALFGAQIGLPMVGGLLVPDNPGLNAYATLKAEERGQVKLEKPQRAELFRHIVGYMPSVPPKENIYNKLVKAMSLEMAERGMSLQDALKLTGDPKAFTAFAAEVDAKQKAAAVPVAAATPAAEVKPAAVAPMIAANANVNSVAHDGRISERQKALV